MNSLVHSLQGTKFLFRSFAKSLRMLHESRSLILEKEGDPVTALQLKTVSLPPLKDNEVVVQFLAASVNPSDLYAVKGLYGRKLILPAVPGNEGVGKIVEVGSAVKSLQVGDHVFPRIAGSGTWRSKAIFAEQHLQTVDRELSPAAATVLAVNPCTAYLLLRDHVNLEEGDVVLQNGCTSAVGIYLIQLAKRRGIKTVNIMRHRADSAANELIKSQLMELGATLVLTDKELVSAGAEIRLLANGRPVKLAIDCVGGADSASLIDHLSKNGTLVVYGGMSGAPSQILAGPLIFKGVSVRGFWLTSWLENKNNRDAAKEMLQSITQWLKEGSLQLSPYEEIPIDEWKKAVQPDDAPTRGLPKKKLLIFPDN